MAIPTIDRALAINLIDYLSIAGKGFDEFRITTLSQGGPGGPSLCVVGRRDGFRLSNLIVARTDRDYYQCNYDVKNSGMDPCF